MKQSNILLAACFLLISKLSLAVAVAEQDVLTEIDNICGDTWCEGEFAFDFKKVNCSAAKKSCTVDFVMSKTAESSAAKKAYAVSCALPGMASFGDMLDKSTGDHAYYTPFSRCISDLERLIRLSV